MSDSDNLVLLFTPDNVCNTTITDKATGDALYTVMTEFPRGRQPITLVRNRSEEVIATCEWRDSLPDVITHGEGGKPMPISSWMRKSLIPFKETVYFQENGMKYKWKGYAAGRALHLFRDDDKKSAIAAFTRSRLDNRVSPPTRTEAILELDPRAIEIQDTIVVGFLFLEKTRRTMEAESQSRGDALGSGVGISVVGGGT